MSRKKVETVGFAEIFEYAEKKHGIGWNPCNDLFFGNAIKYKGATSFYKLDGIDAKTLGIENFSYEDEDMHILIDAVMKFSPDKSRIFIELSDRIKDQRYADEVADIIINQFVIENELDDEILILAD